jgi:hypothetical protein
MGRLRNWLRIAKLVPLFAPYFDAPLILGEGAVQRLICDSAGQDSFTWKEITAKVSP